MLIKVEGDDYTKCVEAAKNYWASSKKGNYGRGLINSEGDPTKVERTGLLGEMAFSIFSGLPVDFSYKKGGDKTDFILNGMTIDVKTAASNYGANCIKAYTASGKYVFRELDVYVAAYVQEDNGEFAIINLVGYELGKNIKEYPIKGARARGLHKNFELDHKRLKPIENLTVTATIKSV